MIIPQHGIAGHQDLVDSARSKGSAPATPPSEPEQPAFKEKTVVAAAPRSEEARPTQ